MLKRSPKYVDKYCESINEFVGIRYTRVESAEEFQDIFPSCLNKEECKCQDCLFKIGERGKLYIDWPNKASLYSSFLAKYETI